MVCVFSRSARPQTSKIGGPPDPSRVFTHPAPEGDVDPTPRENVAIAESGHHQLVGKIPDFLSCNEPGRRLMHPIDAVVAQREGG
jgi:hypothetical protein